MQSTRICDRLNADQWNGATTSSTPTSAGPSVRPPARRTNASATRAPASAASSGRRLTVIATSATTPGVTTATVRSRRAFTACAPGHGRTALAAAAAAPTMTRPSMAGVARLGPMPCTPASTPARTPITMPPTIAPTGLSRPPTITETSANTRTLPIIVGLSSSTFANSMPAIAPATEAIAHPSAYMRAGLMPTMRAAAGLSAVTRSPSPTLVNRNSAASSSMATMATAALPRFCRVTVISPMCKGRPAHRRREAARGRVPQGVRQPVEQREQPEGDHHGDELRTFAGRVDHQQVDQQAQPGRDHRDGGHRREERPVRLGDQLPGDEGGEGGHLAGREVHHAGGSEHDHQREGGPGRR